MVHFHRCVRPTSSSSLDGLPGWFWVWTPVNTAASLTNVYMHPARCVPEGDISGEPGVTRRVSVQFLQWLCLFTPPLACMTGLKLRTLTNTWSRLSYQLLGWVRSGLSCAVLLPFADD